MAAPKTKIFVGHLPDGCTDEDLRTLFQKYGEVTECDVINKYGFVHMASPEQADEAVKMLNNYNLMGSSISVEPSKSKLHPEPGAPGRANKQTVMNRRGGGPPRNGFMYRGGFSGGGGGFPNGFRRFDGPPMGGDSYYERPFGFARDRMRPYPPPYERRSPMPPMRDDYPPRRPMPMVSADPYSRPLPPMSMREDLYERRPMVDRSDYLYSRRSPPASSMSRTPYWYDSVADGSSRAPPPSATRRPTYF